MFDPRRGEDGVLDPISIPLSGNHPCLSFMGGSCSSEYMDKSRTIGINRVTREVADPISDALARNEDDQEDS